MSIKTSAVGGDEILEPLKAYKTKYEGEFRRNCEEYFDGLVKQSGIDATENKKTVSAYNAQMQLVEESKRQLSRYKALRALFIAMIAIGAVLLIAAIVCFVADDMTAGGILCAVGGVLIAAGIGLLIGVALPRIRENEKKREARQQKANELMEQAWKQMAPLNALFENTVTKKLIEKTVPLIRLDDFFNVRRYDYLNGKYGYAASEDPERSTIGILTGEIVGNPFVVDRVLVESMGSCTYTGSIVITWETYETDSEGHPITVHHSETLTASVTRPKPYYSEQTRLVYGNEAAPDLHFSRSPAHVEDLSEKAREGRVKRGAKKIRKKQEKALERGGSFTEMGNQEFDVLFGALDRDNDVQFRLLFTPLAQKNLLALLTDGEGYGDDFSMRKVGCLNYISSEHSAQWDMEERRERYYSYSVDGARNLFLTFNGEYFKSLYFDLAPLLSIPLYQQHKPHEYIYREEFPRNFTVQESEYAVNRMDATAFAPPYAATPSILKTSLAAKDGKSDRLVVTANAYRAVPHTEFVSVFGGDGFFHSVPVDWVEYVPIQSNTIVEMKELGLSDREFFREANSGVYRVAMEKYGKRAFGYNHGILCCVVSGDDRGFDADFTVKK